MLPDYLAGISHNARPNWLRWLSGQVRGCLHDTGATFALERVHSGETPSHGSIFVYMIPPQISCWRESPQFLYRGKNFTPVRNLTTVSCKHETTTRFGVKSVCRWTGTGSACVMFTILNHTCILSTWSVPSNNESSCKHDTKRKSHVGMKLTPLRVFSCKHPLIPSHLVV